MLPMRVSRRDLIGAIGAVVAVNIVGAAPAIVVGADTDWFDKPPLYPPEVVFPIAWTFLFTLMGIAVYLIWRADRTTRAVRVALGLFALQMAINVAWTPVFFGLERADLGLFIIAALWIAIVATIAAFNRVDRRAAALLVPYLAWVTFAAVLNFAILFE